MLVARIQANWMRVLLLFSMGSGCFAYGFSAGLFKIFPYTTISHAWIASGALLNVATTPKFVATIDETKRVLVPTVENHGQVDKSELILMSGGPGYLKDHQPEGCLAWLMDRAGNIKHTWANHPDLWNDLQVVSKPFNVLAKEYPVGVHLYENGDLLVNYQGDTTFPFGLGMARFDKHSKLLWKKELVTHHWFSVSEDGRIFVPSHRVIDSPLNIGNTEWNIISSTSKIYDDQILVLDGNGNVLDQISLLEAMVQSGWGGLLRNSPYADDPLHLNDVQVVDRNLASSNPWVSEGDLLISMRNISSVGILDPKQRRFKWMSTGAVVEQHSPRFFSDGVLVLDNLGGNRKQGGTQLVHIHPLNSPKTLFPRPNSELPETCRTANSGHLDVHRDGNRVLMSLTRSGAVWEVDLRTAEVNWEYMYVHPNDHNGIRQSIFTAKYIYNASFLSSGEAP